MSSLKITKLIAQINEFTDKASGDIQQRNTSVASVVGGVIGTQLTIPSTAVKNTRLYYQDQIYPVVADYINQINESYPIDIDVALECAYLIWVDRYKMVHVTRVDVTDMIFRLNCSSVFIGSSLDLARVEGLSRVLDNNDTKLMNGVFLELMNQIQTTVED